MKMYDLECDHEWKYGGPARGTDRATAICKKCNVCLEISTIETIHLTSSIMGLRYEIKEYSVSSGKHADAIKKLNWLLISVGILQVIVLGLQTYVIYQEYQSNHDTLSNQDIIQLLQGLKSK